MRGNMYQMDNEWAALLIEVHQTNLKDYNPTAPNAVLSGLSIVTAPFGLIVFGNYILPRAFAMDFFFICPTSFYN